MSNDERVEGMMQRAGGWCAIAGALLTLAASLGFASLTSGPDGAAMLRALAGRPDWYWPAVHAGFIVGAACWLAAFIGLNTTLTDAGPRLLGSLGYVALIMGAVIHVLGAVINGSVLSVLAARLAHAAPAEQASLLTAGDTMVLVLHATWAGILALFYGLPFVLSGLGVARSGRYPEWLVLLSLTGGVGSIVAGGLLFLAPGALPPSLFLLFTPAVSVWMICVGYELIRRRAAQPAREALGAAA
ncbi:MAG: hypothetical protein ACT4R6_11905 [Gemmatimonadaceae bacterium]